eukprot:1830228-Amphidinium_carterae.1
MKVACSNAAWANMCHKNGACPFSPFRTHPPPRELTCVSTRPFSTSTAAATCSTMPLAHKDCCGICTRCLPLLGSTACIP